MGGQYGSTVWQDSMAGQYGRTWYAQYGRTVWQDMLPHHSRADCPAAHLHGDGRVESQQVLGGLQVDGLQQYPLSLAVLAGIIQGSGQVEHDGGVVLVVLLQRGGVQLDGCRDLALRQVQVCQVDGHVGQVQPVNTSTGSFLNLKQIIN